MHAGRWAVSFPARNLRFQNETAGFPSHSQLPIVARVPDGPVLAFVPIEHFDITETIGTPKQNCAFHSVGE